MEAFKIVGFAIISVVLVVVLKEQRKEMALVLSITAGIILLFFTISKLETITEMLNMLVERAGVDKNFLIIILKITGIAYIVEFGKNVCQDAGQTAIGTKLEIAGKVIIVTLSLPLISALVNVLTGLV